MRNLIPNRLLLSFVTVLAAIFLFGGVALAANPHFTTASASGPDAAGALSVTFQEAGLGNAGTINYETTAARVTATFACLNASGEVVSENTETVGVTNFTSASRHGQNRLTVELSTGPDISTCPADQTIALAAITYADITITDTTNSVTTTIPGTFTRTLI